LLGTLRFLEKTSVASARHAGKFVDAIFKLFHLITKNEIFVFKRYYYLIGFVCLVFLKLFIFSQVLCFFNLILNIFNWFIFKLIQIFWKIFSLLLFWILPLFWFTLIFNLFFDQLFNTSCLLNQLLKFKLSILFLFFMILNFFKWIFIAITVKIDNVLFFIRFK
jgi:hypothetical protein